MLQFLKALRLFNDAVIDAGSVVTKNIPEKAIEVVNLAKVINNTADNFKKRDKKAIHRIRCKC